MRKFKALFEWEKHGKWAWIEVPMDLWWMPLVRFTANPFYLTCLYQAQTSG